MLEVLGLYGFRLRVGLRLAGNLRGGRLGNLRFPVLVLGGPRAGRRGVAGMVGVAKSADDHRGD
ncbi:hypothetical protein CK224_29260 [Mesorhizobium sp. WSM3862]|nr:hypothetical protein CK224_29260 [Mesorhizobium sp. WSM3862]